jgi:hypothetical protein
MRVLRVVLVALFGVFAMFAGLVMAAVVSLATALFLGLRRALHPAGGSGLPVDQRAQPPRPRTGDIIDVTATEVPADSNSR